MANLRLSGSDNMAVTRAMDLNRNNRIDKTEANVSWGAHTQIGNSNGVAGTRETAEALEKGDVFVSRLQPEIADKIADYFSKHNENFNKPVAEWISDAWISKEDFEFDPAVRSLVDSNADNRISSKEFSAALVSGTLTIGAARQVSQNPFSQPAAPKPSSDPFAKPSNDPFAKPAQSEKPSYGGDPFNKPGGNIKPAQGSTPYQPQPNYYPPTVPDSGAYLKIDMLRTMRSDYEKGQVLTDLAGKQNLSPREQVLVAEAVTLISSDSTRGQILQTLAANSTLSEDGQIKVAKMAREVSSDYTKGQIIDTLMQKQRLTPQAQQSVIISIGTLSSDYTKGQSYLSILSRQELHPANKEFLMKEVQNEISSDYSKRQIMDAMFK